MARRDAPPSPCIPSAALRHSLDLHEVPGTGFRIGGLDIRLIPLGVADVVKLNVAAHAIIGDGGQCLQNRLGIRAARSLQGFQSREIPRSSYYGAP